ncbi:cytochrome b5 family heme/steroid binding domain-containing protein [Besnoitia besnoiti]|uniref:Cytochrome b5 family heme/steroid binding domain-containing protein n=1 Tax=Besnoitia besnoiti TaxID=94643 RepID=A0A2A9MF67_BESBE|nr:cytochrome b5 family heme/steroid binding domain-containing protein [Besnoitia besnoiti]PFH34303.1 cytochrome b5 family heme/steroid binding domain-containing protein [Besnoitia besnoiti]
MDSSLASASSAPVGTGGRFTVSLLERLPSLAESPPSTARFRVLEKISYVWQRHEREGWALAEEFERKMTALLLSDAPRGAQATPRLVVQVGAMDGQVSEPLSDLQSLFSAQSPPSHVSVFLDSSPSSDSSPSPARTPDSPLRSFFSPSLPFRLPVSSALSPALAVASPAAVPASDSPTDSAASSPPPSVAAAAPAVSSLSPSPPQLVVYPPSPRSASEPAPASRGDAEAAAASCAPAASGLSSAFSLSAPSAAGGASKDKAHRRKAANGSLSDRGGSRASSQGLLVPKGCGVGSQARFRDLMEMDKGRKAALAGVRRRISLEELARHRTREDLWVALDGIVYDISSYVAFHPGGARILVEHAGRDISEVFRRYHAWVNAQHILEYNQVGVLE